MKYLIFGAGSHGKVVMDILLRLGLTNNDIYFIDVFKKRFEEFKNCKVLGSLDEGFEVPHSSFKAILSYAGDPRDGNQIRETKSSEIEKKLLSIAKKNYLGMAQIIDPSAIVSKTTTIGTNVSIGVFSFLNIDSKIGNGVIINNNCLIEHDVEIEDYSNISPSVTLLGNVKIGKRVFIGGGSIIRNNISIGNDSVIGMGSVIIKDIPSNSLVIGNKITKLH